MLAIFIGLHIIAGAVGLLAGFITILLAKGNGDHRRYGKLYLYAMLTLGLTGVVVALVRDIPLSMLNGLVICYLVLSSLSAIKNGAYRVSHWDSWLAGGAWALVLAFAWYAYQVSQTAAGQLGGFGMAEYLVFGTVMLLSALADLRYLAKSGLSSAQTLARHLWRMFFPLLMAAAAFFLGQAKLFPQALQSIEILIAPVAFVLLAMIYWWIKVMIKGRAAHRAGSLIDVIKQ